MLMLLLLCRRRSLPPAAHAKWQPAGALSQQASASTGMAASTTPPQCSTQIKPSMHTDFMSVYKNRQCSQRRRKSVRCGTQQTVSSEDQRKEWNSKSRGPFMIYFQITNKAKWGHSMGPGTRRFELFFQSKGFSSKVTRCSARHNSRLNQSSWTPIIGHDRGWQTNNVLSGVRELWAYKRI